MPNDTTMMSDLINPEVLGELIEEKLQAQLKATKYAKLDHSLEGNPGDTKKVTAWGYVGAANEVGEGEQVERRALTTSTAQYTIKKAGLQIPVTQEAVNSGAGKPLAVAARQISKAIADKIDNDVVEQALNADTVIKPSTLAQIGYPGIVDAVVAFMDEEDGVDKVMFINPYQEGTLMKDSNFLSADKFEKGVAVNGAIGKVAGCWIKRSKKVKLVSYQISTQGTSGAKKVVKDASATSSDAKLSEVQLNVWDPAKSVVRSAQPDEYVLALADSAKFYACPIIKLEPDSAETEETEDELPAITMFVKKKNNTSCPYDSDIDTYKPTSYSYYGVAATNRSKLVVACFKK